MIESLKTYVDFHKIWKDILEDFENLKDEYGQGYIKEIYPNDFNISEYLHFMTEQCNDFELDSDECEIDGDKVQLIFSCITDHPNESDNSEHGVSCHITYDFSKEEVTYFSCEGF